MRVRSQMLSVCLHSGRKYHVSVQTSDLPRGVTVPTSASCDIGVRYVVRPYVGDGGLVRLAG